MTKPKKKKSIVRAAWDYISETHLFKIMTSEVVANTATTTLAILTLIGVIATPAGPLVVGVLAGVTFASVAVKVIAGMLQARNLRHLEKENNLLVKNRDAKDQQVKILKDNPKLENILEGELFQPAKEGKKSVTQRLARDSSKREVMAKSVGKAFLKQGVSIGLAIAKSITTGGMFLAMKIAGIAISVFSFGMDAKSIVDIATVRSGLKKQIDSERDKADTPGYNNIKDLKIQVREQRIQTMALNKLVSDKNYPSMSPEQIKTRFAEIKVEISASEKAIITSRNILARAAKMTFSLIKDAGRGQSPYSNLNNPKKIVINKPGMDDQSLAEKSQPRKLSQIAAELTTPIGENVIINSPSKVKNPIPHKKNGSSTRHK